MKQEFLPKSIGDCYGFPQRTVLSECERMDAENVDNIIALLVMLIFRSSMKRRVSDMVTGLYLI